MNRKEQIKAYWRRIDKIERRISELHERGIGYSNEWKKRKSLLANVKFLENKSTPKSPQDKI